MKSRLLILFALILTKLSYCQNTGIENCLLWRISGKGLASPSYLYGTMHVTDKRIFYFTDSLYKALENTEGFASEIDINKLGNESLAQLLEEEEEKYSRERIKVRDAVSPEVWEMYKEALEKKISKPASRITVDDLENIDSKLSRELLRSGEMPTFLDAYLFGLAKKQGKWLGGLEELQDQLEHIETETVEEKIQTALFDDKYYRTGIEWMIKMYLSQHIDSIDVLTYRHENGEKDFIMIKRNRKMASGIDSLSAIRSTLFAVGVAHLAGDSGLVSLLRSKGFTVSPVFSKKKIDPDKYVVKNAVPADWATFSIKDSAYSIQMPGQPTSIKRLNELGLPCQMFFDLSAMRMYMTICVEISDERKKAGLDSIYNAVKKQFVKQGKIIYEKKITVNKIEGRDYRFSNEDGEYRMQVFLPKMERLIANCVGTLKDKTLQEPETERFFQSLVINENYQPPAQTEKQWTTLTYPDHSFSIDMPLKPRERKDVNSQEGKILYTYQAFEVGHPNFYGMVVSSMKEGMFLSGNDSTYFLSVQKNLEAGFQRPVVLDSEFVNIEGFPAYRLTIRGIAEGEPVEIKTLSLLRGNRSYYLFSVYEPKDTARVNATRFIKSFNVLPYHYGEWKTMSPADDQSFSTSSPFRFKRRRLLDFDFHPDADRWVVYDTLISATMFVDKIVLPNWFWYTSDTSLLRTRAMKYALPGDSVVGYETSRSGNLISAEFNVEQKHSQLIKKVKIILDGNILFEIFGTMSKDDLNNIYSRFYDDFKVVNIENHISGKTIQKDSLIHILRTADKKEIKIIKHWWDDLEFTDSDISWLQKISLSVYPGFDTTYYMSNLNGKIFEAIKRIDCNHTSLQYFKDQYPAMSSSSELIKPFIISYLASIKTKESYDLLKNCLTKYSFPDRGKFLFRFNLSDSLPLTARLFPDIMKLAENDALWKSINAATCELFDSNLLSKVVIKLYGDAFIGKARKILRTNKQEIEDGSYLYFNLIKILGIISTPESNTLLNQFAKFKDHGIRFHTMLAKISAGMPADNMTLYTLATQNQYREELFLGLQKMNKLGLFPKSFLSQRQLAESKLYMYAWEDDAPMFVTYVTERTMMYEGKNSKFYVFKISVSGMNDDYYLGVAGPYSLLQTDYSSSHKATGIYYEKLFDAKKIDPLLKEYFKSLKKDESD